LIVVSSSNSQGLLMEIPSLCSSTVRGFNNHVPEVIDQIKVSVVW